MRRSALAVFLIVFGCGAPAQPESRATSDAPPAASTPAAAQPSAPQPSAPQPEPPQPEPPQPEPPPEPEIAIPAAPLLASGLPAMSRGKAIVLESLPVSDREVGGTTLPSVELADPQARAALDAQIENENDYGPCKVMLALATFVSVRCPEHYSDTGMEHRDHHIAHFVIEGTAVRKVAWIDMVHPGLSERDLVGVLLHDAEAGQRRVVFTTRGLELSYPFDGESEIDRIPWRALGPYLRADSVLAPILAAEGVPLAPVGTTLTMPAKAPGLRPKYGAGAGEDDLLRLWLLAPDHLRAHARFATPGGREPAILVLNPGSDRAALDELVARGPTELGVTFLPVQSYYTDQIAPVVLVRTLVAIELRDKPGQSEPVTGNVPELTEVASLDGLLHRSDSAPGSSSWAYVVTREGLHGWTKAKNLERLDLAAKPSP